MTTDFTQFDLPSSLVNSLSAMNIAIPTPIQAAAIPAALQGSDILASAHTGSGKTLAFLIPILKKISEDPATSSLILTPTRELATQVIDTLKALFKGSKHGPKTALLIGGAPIHKQLAELKRQPHIILGTPGRVQDHLSRRSLSLDETEFFVLDEADRMLDMGFEEQLEEIATFLPKKRQTLMFSATFPPNIERLAGKYLNEPKRLSTNNSKQTIPKIEQEVLTLREFEKFPELLKQLEKREGSILIFTKTKRGADKLSRDLKDHGHTTGAIHGDLPQRKRDRVIQGFRAQKNRIMVATDVAARGLDIPHIMHVINYDFPQCSEDYIHRIGRTARGGAKGEAVCFLAPSEKGKWNYVLRLMDPNSKAPSSEERSKLFPDRRSGGRSSRFKKKAGAPYKRGDRSEKAPWSKKTDDSSFDRKPSSKKGPWKNNRSDRKGPSLQFGGKGRSQKTRKQRPL